MEKETEKEREGGGGSREREGREKKGYTLRVRKVEYNKKKGYAKIAVSEGNLVERKNYSMLKHFLNWSEGEREIERDKRD